MLSLTILSKSLSEDLFQYEFSETGELQKVRCNAAKTAKPGNSFCEYKNNTGLSFPNRFGSFLGPYTNAKEFKGKRLVLFCRGERPAPEVYSLVFTTYFLSFAASLPPKSKMDSKVEELSKFKHIPHPILTPEQEYTVTFDLTARAVSVSEQGGAPRVLLPSEYPEYLDSPLLRDYLSRYFPELDQNLPLGGEWAISNRFWLVAACQNWRALNSHDSYVNVFLFSGLRKNILNLNGKTQWEILGIDQAFFSDKWAPFLESTPNEFALLQRITKTHREDVPEILDTWERLAKLCGGLRRNQYTFFEYLNLYGDGDSDPKKIYEDISRRLKNGIQNTTALSAIIRSYPLP